MLIKVINFRRKNPRTANDLRRLIRYLLSPKMSRNQGKTPARLLGPPDLHHLLLNSLPWGPGINDAAADLTEQMIRYTRAARAGHDIPDVWYVHILVSFAPSSARDLRNPPDPHRSPSRGASQTRNALRLTYDALDALGWPMRQPAIFVVHGDRRHIHVHGVLALVFPSGEVANALTTSRRVLNEVAEMCADAFGLKLTRRARKAHERYVEALSQDDFALSTEAHAD